MHQEIQKILSEVDKRISTLDSNGVQTEFENIPLEIFGQIQIDRLHKYKNLMRWLPKMPSPEIQRSWTGAADHELMRQSINFVRLSVSKYHEISRTPMGQSNVLDFGCGWGRLTRLLYKYVPVERLYGVDPWDRSIEICRDCDLPGSFYMSDYIPRELPTPTNVRFDFIIAFSVFTHLSENVTKVAIRTLENYLTDKGVIALTIRPKEYWSFAAEHDESI